jgi:uncharacterized membrane protein (DUF106 family)
MFVTLIALVAVSALSAFAGPVSASLSYYGEISADNFGVKQSASYTFVIKNDGADKLVALNITIPSRFTNIDNLAVNPSTWSINHDGSYIYLNQSDPGLNTGASLTVTFDAINPSVATTYTWVIVGDGTDGSETSEFTSEVTSSTRVTTMTPVFILLAVVVGLASLNTVLNRVLISHFVGWEQYHVMRKEIAAFQKEQMAAARANDPKQIDKLKRKQSQITNMRAKMMKPQFLQMGVSFIQIAVWLLVLLPTFQDSSIAFLPGFGPIPVLFLYPILSISLSTLAQRIVGTLPIE